MRLRTWLPLVAVILGSPAWAAESKPAVYTFGTLKAPSVETARTQAQAWLEKAGQWGAVKDRVVPAVDVRAALAAVESGLMDAGIVYATDAALSRKVRILLEVPVEDGPPISYPLAILRNRPHPERARKVASCLQGPEARAAYVALGFTVKSEAP